MPFPLSGVEWSRALRAPRRQKAQDSKKLLCCSPNAHEIWGMNVNNQGVPPPTAGAPTCSTPAVHRPQDDACILPICLRNQPVFQLHLALEDTEFVGKLRDGGSGVPIHLVRGGAASPAGGLAGGGAAAGQAKRPIVELVFTCDSSDLLYTRKSLCRPWRTARQEWQQFATRSQLARGHK